MAINKNKLIASAQRLTQRGQLDRAIREYRTIVEHDPDDVRVWMKIGALYVRKGATQHAVATYNRVAAHYRENGHHQKAAAVYKQIIGLVPGAIDAHLNLADVLGKLGQNLEAVNELQIVVGAYEREGRHRDSCELLARIVDLAPEEEANRIRLAEAFARQNDTAAATREFRAVLAQLHRNQRFDDFIQVAERLLYLAPDEIDVVRQLAEVYLQRRQPKRALARLQVLFQNDPSNTAVLDMLGQAFNDLGYRGKAISVYRELARLHGAQGNDSARLDAFRSLLTIDPNDPEALDATGASDPLSRPPGRSRTVDVSSAPRAIAPVASGIDRLARYVEDAQLYLKYSLTDHAQARIDLILETEPLHIDGLALKAEVLQSSDQGDEAARIYEKLAELTSGEQAMGFLGRLLDLRPNDADAQARMRALSGNMAAERSKVISIAPPAAAAAAVMNPDPYEVELNLDGVDFDDGLQDDFGIAPDDAIESFDFELDLDAFDEPPPDDDAFSDLLGGDDPPPKRPTLDPTADVPRRAFGDLEADDAFGDLIEPDASTSLGASEYDDDAFGDLLADEPGHFPSDGLGDLLAPEPSDDFGGLLAPAPAGASSDAAPAPDDTFGDLLAPEPGPSLEISTPGAPLATEDDDAGDLLSMAEPEDELPVPAGEGAFDQAPSLLAPVQGDSLGFSDLQASEVVQLDDHSFGDLLAELGDGDEPAAQTAEVLPGARDLSVPDIDFGSLPPSKAPEPLAIDLDDDLDLEAFAESIDVSGAKASSDGPIARHDDLDIEIESLPPPPAGLRGFDRSVSVPPAPPVDDSPDDSAEFSFDEERGVPVDDDFDDHLDDDLEGSLLPDDLLASDEIAPDDFDTEAVVAALPGVIDAVSIESISIDMVDEDDIIELDDDAFLEEPSAPKPPPITNLKDRLAQMVGSPDARPAPPPLPGGSLFDMAGQRSASKRPVSQPPPLFDAPDDGVIEESLAGAEFFNIGAEVEWPALEQEIAALDALIAQRKTGDARRQLSDLYQEHPGHPALSDRLERIREIESQPIEDESLPPPDAPLADIVESAPQPAESTESALLASVEVRSHIAAIEEPAAPPSADEGEVDFGTIQGSTVSELAEDDAMTHFDLGVAFKEMGQYKKAVERLELARQNSELYAEATRVLASAQHERGKSEVAVDLLREAIGDARVTHAAQLGLRYELAGIFETIGRHPDAADELRLIAQQAAKDFPDVNARLARLGG